MRFEDWSRESPLQKRALSLYPDYVEPTVKVSVNGLEKRHLEKLHVYVAQARFIVASPPEALELPRHLTPAFLEKIDPAIKHHAIAAEKAIPNSDPEFAYNRRPDRPWCQAPQSLCLESRYDLEGKLPIGIRLANKLEDGQKKIADYLEFQSELRVLPPEEIQAAEFAKLTRLEEPVVGAIEQNLFFVNQVIQTGKLLVVLQSDPTRKDRTIATAFMTLAVESDVLEKKKEFERVPVLRNLVPAQVLMGHSSFNSGKSISAGLPAYTRNHVGAIAAALEAN